MLEKPLGGRGVLLGGVPGVAAGKVMIIGGGVVGMNAALIAIGMQAEVYVYDRNIDRLRELEHLLGYRASTVFSSTLEIEQRLPEMDLVIGAVLVHGARAPHVITREQLKLMKRNAVLVDVAIDQGGCFETSTSTALRFISESCSRRITYGALAPCTSTAPITRSISGSRCSISRVEENTVDAR